MIDYLFHLLGVCPCEHAHVDLKDLALLGCGAMAGTKAAFDYGRLKLKQLRGVCPGKESGPDARCDPRDRPD